MEAVNKLRNAIPPVAVPASRKVSIICSHGGLDEAYPALILANAARQSGIECMVFFTFWGLDVITEDRVDHLHVNLAGNPTSGMPTVLAGLPVHEYTAGQVKQAVVGKGRALKPQVQEMVRRLLQLPGAPAKDCAC